MLALATVLSMIKIFTMPMDGSVTLLSMLPIVLISIKRGVKVGLCTSFLYSLIQLGLSKFTMFAWGLTPVAIFGTITLDYLLAFTVLGLAGIFRDWKKPLIGEIAGIVMVMVLRFLCHFIAGVIIFGQWAPEGWGPVFYSLCYNGAYMLPELIFTVIGAVVMLKTPYIRKLFAPTTI